MGDYRSVPAMDSTARPRPRPRLRPTAHGLDHGHGHGYGPHGHGHGYGPRPTATTTATATARPRPRPQLRPPRPRPRLWPTAYGRGRDHGHGHGSATPTTPSTCDQAISATPVIPNGFFTLLFDEASLPFSTSPAPDVLPHRTSPPTLAATQSRPQLRAAAVAPIVTRPAIAA